MNGSIEALANQAVAGERLSRDDAVRLLAQGVADPYRLFAQAWRIRTAHFGRRVHFCSIVSGRTGACGEDCKWCAQSGHHSAQAAGFHRTNPQEIVSAARQAVESGCGCFSIVNSGRGPDGGELTEVCHAASVIGPEFVPSGATFCRLARRDRFSQGPPTRRIRRSAISP